MSNGNKTAPPSTLFEYVIQALSPRSKHAIDLTAFNMAQGKVESKKKGKMRRGHLKLAYSNGHAK